MKKFIKFLFFAFIFGVLSNSLLLIAEEPRTKKDIKLHNLPIKSRNLKKNQIVLKTLPLPLIEVASNSSFGYADPILILIFSDVLSPTTILCVFLR